MTMVVTEPCKGCKDKACLKVCPCDCFYEDADMVYISFPMNASTVKPVFLVPCRSHFL